MPSSRTADMQLEAILALGWSEIVDAGRCSGWTSSVAKGAPSDSPLSHNIFVFVILSKGL